MLSNERQAFGLEGKCQPSVVLSRSLKVPALESTLSRKFKGSCTWYSAKPDSGETGQLL